MGIILSSFKDVAEMSHGLGRVFSFTWFLILPPLFYWIFKLVWMDYVQKGFVNSIDYVLLEIISPQNIEKSPKLMESFFNGLHGVDTTIPNSDIYMRGRMIEYFSLEIVGDSGDVHFYIRCPKWDRGIVEANIYAQYPDAKIIEVEDYVTSVPRIIPNKKWEIWGADAKLSDADPLPIRTYNRFQEDVTGKMIDPLSSVLEILGKLGPNQKVWFQILIQPVPIGWEKKEGLKMIEKLAGRKSESKGFFDRFRKDIGDVFGNIIKGMSAPVEFSSEEKKEEAPLEFRLTPGEKEKLKMLEENMTKVQFKTKIRFAYIGKKENFDKAGVVGGFWGAMKQFSDIYSNGIGIYDPTKTYAWYFMVKSRLKYRQRKLFQRYINRDPEGNKFILSTAELATIFHLPDMSAMAPSITRVEAKVGSAPANLPVK